MPAPVAVHIDSTTDELDAAETVARHQDGEGEPSPDTRRFLTAAHARRRRPPAAALDFFKPI